MKKFFKSDLFGYLALITAVVVLMAYSAGIIVEAHIKADAKPESGYKVIDVNKHGSNTLARYYYGNEVCWLVLNNSTNNIEKLSCFDRRP